MRLNKEMSYLRARSLIINILERVPMILRSFLEILIGAFTYCFPMKKNRKRNT